MLPVVMVITDYKILEHSRIDKTSNGPKVKAKDKIIASTWNLVDRSLTSAKISPLSGIVPSTVDTKYSVGLAGKKGDETLMVRSNRSDGYASIVASEQRAELCGRIGTLERDNMRLRGMLGVERQRVDRLRRSMSYAQRDL
ncbi:hypothetical protein Tco_0465547 [Tanacetum coccineum]